MIIHLRENYDWPAFIFIGLCIFLHFPELLVVVFAFLCLIAIICIWGSPDDRAGGWSDM